MKNCLGYDIVCLRETHTVAGGAQRGVGLYTRERSKGWDIDSTYSHGTNVVSCKIVSGLQLTPLIGVYPPLTTLNHLPDLDEAVNIFPGRYPTIMGDLNADASQMKSSLNHQVADFLDSFEMVDLLLTSENGCGSGINRRGGRYENVIFCVRDDTISLGRTASCPGQWTFRTQGTFHLTTSPYTRGCYGSLTGVIVDISRSDELYHCASCRWYHNI